MTKKGSGDNPNQYEVEKKIDRHALGAFDEVLHFIKGQGKDEVIEISSPKMVSDKPMRSLDFVGRIAKFVTIEVISEVVNGAGSVEEKERRLLAITTSVLGARLPRNPKPGVPLPSPLDLRGNVDLPEHIDIYKKLVVTEKVREGFVRIIGTSGGKIPNLSLLIIQAQKYNEQGTSVDERKYGENEPYFESGSMLDESVDDRPDTVEMQEALIEEIKRALEAYAQELQDNIDSVE